MVKDTGMVREMYGDGGRQRYLKEDGRDRDKAM
jgi:hypothetical protein